MASGAARRRLRRAGVRLAGILTRGPEPAGLRILTYHRVNDDHPHDRLSVRPAAFAAQLEELAASGRPVVALESALPALCGDGSLAPGSLAITFDDGYEDNHSVALEILDRFRFPATFFLATGLVGSASTIDRYRGCCQRDTMLTWNQAGELAARGHTLGAHGRKHLELGTLSAEAAREEIEGSADDIEKHTGSRPRSFCYARGSESPAVRRAVATAGFDCACTVLPGANSAGVDPFGLRRTEVSGADDMNDFRLKLAGAFDAWHRLVQRGRALVAR